MSQRFFCSLVHFSVFLLAFIWGASTACAAETQRFYLSGKGKDDPIKWDFFCAAGRNANQWSTIGVPSNWELQGFGNYTYGTEKHPTGWPAVQGRYKPQLYRARGLGEP